MSACGGFTRRAAGNKMESPAPLEPDAMNLRSRCPKLLALALAFATGAALAADPPPLRAGKYVADGGVLTVARAGDGKTTFELVVVSPWNGHTCGPMDGEIRNGAATVAESSDDDGKPSKCVVRFSAHGDAIDVASEGDACSNECGAAVAFDGRYPAFPPECESPALKKTRQQFKSAYDAKNYAKALSVLQPALTRCAEALDFSDVASMRNDVAITQYHLHDAAGCLRTLEPLREDADKTDADLESSYPVFAQDLRLPGIHAARTNLKLCRAAHASTAAQ
jgi:hypothetical protein